MGKGLDKKKIIDVSMSMIEKEGRENFSLHRLASEMGVKTASLYNYVSSFEDLMTDISIEVIQRLIETEENAVKGKAGDEAIRSLAQAYYAFGMEHYELYQIFMNSRQPRKEELENVGVHILDPIMKVFSEIRLSDSEKIHWQRILRSILHGFISEEHAGFFTWCNAPAKDSFEKAIDCFLTGIHTEEGNSHEA